MSGTQLIQVLRSYGIVKGDDTGNLNLEKPITRAEMITILVRALGAESEAEGFRALNPYQDAKGHWAEANIAYATTKNLIKGDGNGTVRPNDPVSYAEALTMIVRLVGQEPTTGTWPTNVILAASDLKMIPDGVTAANIREAGIRGLVFQSLAKAIMTVQTPSGKTFLQTYVDKTPPALTVADPGSKVDAASVRIQGTAQDAVSVTVNGAAADLSGNAFSADVALNLGTNTITVVATDQAGNTSSKQITVVRGTPAASLDISGPNRVRPSGTANYTVTAKDAAGNTISLAGVTASVTGNIGTFDLATGTLKAAQTPAIGKITVTTGTITKSVDVQVMGQDASVTKVEIREINNGAAVSFTKPMTVQVDMKNSNGALVDGDFGRPVSLVASGLTGVKVTPAVAYTEAGVATFTVTAAAMGTVSLSASSGSLAPDSVAAEFGSNQRVKLVADPGSLIVGGATTMSRIKAELRDENGSTVVNNTGSDIVISLEASSTDGYLVDTSVTIGRGQSTSTQYGDDGIFRSGITAGTVTIKGTIQSGQNLTVDPATVSVTVPQIGSGTKLDVFGPVSYLQPGAEGIYVVRVVDSAGNVVPTNSYAFQLKVDTSNAEAKTNGIPEGVHIQLGDTGLNPVSDGITEGATNDTSDVVARTAGGVAVIKVTYDKPGKVTLTPITIGTYATAYNSDGVVAVGNSSQGFSVANGVGVYQAPVTHVVLTATSDGLGTNQPVAAMKDSAASSATLIVTLADDDGRWVPATAAEVTLEKVSGNSTTAPTTLRANTQDGKATFTIRSTSTVGEDVYRVTADVNAGITSNTLTVYVQKTLSAAPVIAAIRGVKDGVPGRLNYVAPDDTGMEIELLPIDGQQWAQIKVYGGTSSAVLYASEAIDMSAVAPKITVPKSSLTATSTTYTVVVRNGAGDSPRSTASDTVVNAVVTSGITVSSARFDAVTKKLTITGSGFATTDTVNTGYMTITDTSTTSSVNLSGARVTVSSSSQMVLDLSVIADVAAQLQDATLFSGSDVNLAVDAGWLTRANGQVAAADLTGNPVTPGARIDYAVFDRSNSRLYVYGQGFNTGTPDYTKLKLTVGGGTEYTLSSFSPTRSSDTQLTFTLSSAAVKSLEDNGAYTITALDKWFADGGAARLGVTDIPVYAQVSLSSVTYSGGKITIKGSGFTGGDVSPSKLSIIDLSTTQSLLLTDAAATVVNDTTIELTLTAGDQATFETAAKFKGSDIYLQGTPGWFVNAQNRSSAGIGSRTLRFPTR